MSLSPLKRGTASVLAGMMFVAAAGCAAEEEPPPPAEVQRFLKELDRAQAREKADAITVSREKAAVRDAEARARVPAQN